MSYKLRILLITILSITTMGCYTQSLVYKEVEEKDAFAQTHIIRQKDNGIVGMFTECNGCIIDFDIVYDKINNYFFLSVFYNGSDWLFIDQIIFLADKNRITLPFEGDSDFYGGSVSEWAVISISKSELLSLVNAKDISCRFSGKYSLDLNSNALKSVQKRWKQFVNGKLKSYM